MKFVIMADGKEYRWQNYLGISKHLVEVNGEPLIYRTIRLLNSIVPKDSEIIVTSHDKRYEFENCLRYEPLNNVLEIDRFTDELIEDNVCFLYGDTYYTFESIKIIVETQKEHTVFFGNKKSIVAIKIFDAEEFKRHKLRIRNLFIEDKIKQCKGWQIYQSFTKQNLLCNPDIKENFVVLDDKTLDINTPEDYKSLVL